MALATAVVVALLATSANSQVLPVEPCRPTILEVSEPVYLGEVLTIQGTCFGDGDGSYLRLGKETQRVDTWTDTLISLTVLVEDPQDTVTITKADGQSTSAGILMSTRGSTVRAPETRASGSPESGGTPFNASVPTAPAGLFSFFSF
ncbi:MAG: hypothetical protein V3S98_07260 [Dehalococcoidia bacterium]